MSNGVLCFANNNETNYIKQAEQLAILTQKYMGLTSMHVDRNILTVVKFLIR